MLSPEQITSGLLWYLVFLFSLTCHEAAHAWAAMKGGDRTAYHFGQVTLNPMPHIQREPFGTLVMPWLTFFLNGWMMGWASAPYDPYWAMRYPKRAAWMSLAGPLANFTLAAISGVLIRIGVGSGLFRFVPSDQFGGFIGPPEGGPLLLEPIGVLLGICFVLNIILGTFNLLPLPGFDGLTALGVILPESLAGKLREFQMNSGMMQFFSIFIAWKIGAYVVIPALGIGMLFLRIGL